MYLPLETTAGVIDEMEREMWQNEREKFGAKTKITIKFGPFEWPDLQTTTPASPTEEEATHAALDEVLLTEAVTLPEGNISFAIKNLTKKNVKKDQK